MFGHTYDSQPGGVGVLDHLKRLRVGKLVKITMGSKTVTCKVKKVVRNAPLYLSERAMAKLLSHLGPPRATLTTCLWSTKQGKYVSRVNASMAC